LIYNKSGICRPCYSFVPPFISWTIRAEQKRAPNSGLRKKAGEWARSVVPHPLFDPVRLCELDTSASAANVLGPIGLSRPFGPTFRGIRRVDSQYATNTMLR
jgi:hypothetical protein